jgi:subtilisin family serine protease
VIRAGRRRLRGSAALLLVASALLVVTGPAAHAQEADDPALDAAARQVAADAFTAAELPADPAEPVPLVVVTASADGPEVTVVAVDDVADAAAVVAAQAADQPVLAVQVDEVVTPLEEAGPSAHTIDVYPQWALDTAQTTFQAAWATTRGAGQVVAVVDTGVHGGHEDLQGAVLPGADFVGGWGTQNAGNGQYDPNGHGTHVAGIIAARAGNGKGIAGAAPDSKILPVRVMAPVYDANGQLISQASGSAADVAAGVLWAANNGATVINLSLGSTGPMEVVRVAIAYAEGLHIPVVVAAGNAGANTRSWPAVYAESIAVAATDSTRSLASYSSWWTSPAYVDIAAPGSSITSTWSPQAFTSANYMGATGTSMATPHVAAAVALIRSLRPDLDVAGVRSVLEGTADDIATAGVDASSGAGLVDPAGAVQALTGSVAAASSGYRALPGARAIDTRSGAPVPGGGVVAADIAGAATGVPADATAAALNVTAVEAQGEGFLTVWPATSSGACLAALRPDTSTVNYVQGDVRATGAIVGLGGGGRICVATSASAHVLVDVVGYLTANAGDRLTPVVPRRLEDTRGDAPVGPRVLRVSVPGDAPGGTSAAALNVTVTEAQGDGFVTVYPADGAGNCGAPTPTSNLNYRRGMTRANLVYGTLGGARALCVYASAPTHVIVDLTGYLGPSGDAVFVPRTPQRLVDTRQGAGVLRVSQTKTVPLALDVVAAQLNVTATAPEGDGFLTAWPCAESRPDTSTVNYRLGETSPNGTTVSAAGGAVCVASNVPTHVIVDATGAWVRP